MGRARDFLQGRANIESQKEEVGIGDFVAFAKISESTRYASSMPTIPLENGEPISEHISLQPIEISIEGRVADVFLREDPVVKLQRRINASIGRVTRYLPVRAQSQIQRVNEAINTSNDIVNKIDELIDSGESAARYLGNLTGQSDNLESFIGSGDQEKTNQEKFLDQMELIHFGKQLIPIQTKFRNHKDMRITELVIDRDNQNEAINFSITAQQARFVETEVVDISEFFEDPSQDTQGQADEKKDKGTQSGEDVTGDKRESTLSKITGAASEFIQDSGFLSGGS